MMGDVGAVAGLLDTVVSWVLSPDGYAKWTAGRERERVKNEAVKALHAQDWATVNDRLVALKRLSQR